MSEATVNDAAGNDAAGNDMAQWHRQNEAYLRTALHWLKLRLQQRANTNTVDRSSKSLFEQVVPRQKVSPGDLQQAKTAMEAAANVSPPPALRLVRDMFGLSTFEQQVLLLCVAMELDTQVEALCACAQDHPQRPYPTFALALSLFDNPTWDVVSSDRPLRYWRLIEVHPTTTQPLTASPLRADERIVNFIKGLNGMDDRLRPFVTPIMMPMAEDNRAFAEGLVSPVALPSSQEAIALKVVDTIRRSPQSWHQRALPIIQLVGTDTLSQQLVAQHVAMSLGLELYGIAANLLPTQLSELETLERLCQRACRLLPILFYIDTHLLDSMEGAARGTETIHRLNCFLNRSQGLFLVGTRDIQRSINRPSVVFDIEKPTTAEQKVIWDNVLNQLASVEQPESPHTVPPDPEDIDPEDPDQAALLASQFRLNAITIYRIAASVRFDLGEEKDAITKAQTNQLIWQACRSETRPQLENLAQRLDPRATWKDIVLPKEETALLHQIADQVRQRNTVYEEWGFQRRMNRGLGISTLFAGESGTGKTMAAEVIANELALDLYRIDLSAVVSKYIGETEKNLRRVFDAAEGGGAILFFDEADALFGKRSDVNDSHDRYANIEINYLLQRIESYRGLAILATNFKSALDSAFLRRLRFIVNFPFPSAKERQMIWQKAFPSETPQSDLNFKRLARFDLTGGSIHNIVLNAAFLAAQVRSSVTMIQVLEAVRTELRKRDQPINPADFEGYGSSS